MARLFADPNIVGLPPEAIVCIEDEEEASAIVGAIAAASKKATDTLIVYYAGHGLYGDQQSPLYLAAGNTTSSDKTFNAVDITKVKFAIASSPAHKRILILDCCYSGRAFDGGMDANEITPAIDIKGTCGIAAVPGDYKALAPPNAQLTKFTQHIVHVLEKGIPGDAQVLTVGDLFDAVKTEVIREGALPPPQQINSNDGMRFKLAKNCYLKTIGLDPIIRSIDGLRETVTLTGARIKALEAKMDEVGQLRSQLPELEARLEQKLRSTFNQKDESFYISAVSSARVRVTRVFLTLFFCAAIDLMSWLGLYLTASTAFHSSPPVDFTVVHRFLIFALSVHTGIVGIFGYGFVFSLVDRFKETVRRARNVINTTVSLTVIVFNSTVVGAFLWILSLLPIYDVARLLLTPPAGVQ